MRPEETLEVQWENKCVSDLVQYVNCLTSVFGLSLWEHLRQLPYKFPVLRKQEEKKITFSYGSLPWREVDPVVPHLQSHGPRLGKVKSGMEDCNAVTACLRSLFCIAIDHLKVIRFAPKDRQTLLFTLPFLYLCRPPWRGSFILNCFLPFTFCQCVILLIVEQYWFIGSITFVL